MRICFLNAIAMYDVQHDTALSYSRARNIPRLSSNHYVSVRYENVLYVGLGRVPFAFWRG